MYQIGNVNILGLNISNVTQSLSLPMTYFESIAGTSKLVNITWEYKKRLIRVILNPTRGFLQESQCFQ
jgi:hypothetical protein